MALKLRPTVGSGIDKDRLDYTVFTGDRQRSDDALGWCGDPRSGKSAVSEELGRLEGLGEIGRELRRRFAASEAMTPEYLAKPLSPFPLPTTDGWMLRTIADTGAYILALPKKRRRLARWKQVSRLIVKEAGVATVTQQVHHALKGRQARCLCV